MLLRQRELSLPGVGKVFYTSDLHLGHKNIVKYEPSRTEHFAETFRANYLSMVGQDDTVFFLGDIALTGKTAIMEYFSSLPGRKILVKGNHDKKGTDFYATQCGFEVVAELYAVRGQLLLSHYPLTNIDERYLDRIRRLNEVAEEKGCTAQVHGHTHSKFSPDPRCFNVSVEVRGMAPVEESVLLEEIKARIGAAQTSNTVVLE